MELIKENDMMEKIKQEIYRLYPIQNPREKENIPYAEMEINIEYSIRENEPYTSIYFLNGNDSYKISTETSYLINEHISNEKIRELINYLLAEFPIIAGLDVRNNSYILQFIYPMEMESIEGVSCNSILLNINIRQKELLPLLRNCFKDIIMNYYDKMKTTPLFQNEYQKFCEQYKETIINELSDEDIMKLLNQLPKEDKISILKNISENYLLEFYDKKNQQEEIVLKNLVKRF